MSGFTFGAAPPASGSLFGNASASAATKAPTFGGFTTPNPQQHPGSGSMFGQQPQPPANPAAGGQFGATPQSSNANTAGGMFGASTGASGGGGLFGSANQQQAGGAGGGLFGANNQQKTGGSLFGSAGGQQQATSGGMFGATGQQSGMTGGGLFESTQQQQQQGATGGGMFGSTNQQQPGATGSSLFGAVNQQPGGTAGGSMFGSTNQQQGAGGGLFGASTQQQSGTPRGGLFSSSNPVQPAPGGGLFGSTMQQPQQSLFASTSAPFGASTNMGSSGSFAPKPELDVEQKALRIKQAWDPSSPDHRFKTFFYNVVDPGTTQQYGRPAGATDEAQWARAVRDTPDPSTMVPVLATGWADLKKRVQMQENVASVHQQRLKEINTALSNLTRQTTLSSSIRLANLQTQRQSLLHRLIHLASLTPQLMPALQSTQSREDEEVYAKLAGVKSELEGRTKKTSSGIGPVGLGTPRRGHNQSQGRMLGQINEMWGMVEEIRRNRKIRGSDGREGWLGDERILGEIAEILSTQQMALQKLNELLNNAVFDAEVMQKGLGMSSG